MTAFELGAVDYLLKPFGATRLLAALDRVRAAIGEPVATPTLERLADALGHGPISRLFVRSGHALVPVPVDSVLWFEADGDYVIARTARAKPLMHLALSRLEARLDTAQFVRIHRTHIVNMAHVVAFKRDAAGRVHAAMSDARRCPSAARGHRSCAASAPDPPNRHRSVMVERKQLRDRSSANCALALRTRQ